MSTTISLNDIKFVRGTEPDQEHGGTMVDGVILGPKKSVCRWRIKDEPRLFYDREDAKKVIQSRMLSEELYKALGFDLDHRPSHNPPEIIQRIKTNGHAIKSVLTHPKYRSIICDKTA